MRVFLNNLGFPRARTKILINMGRFANYPTTIEEVKTISITKLKAWNYLVTGQHTGVITWSRNGTVTSTISIQVVFTDFQKYVVLDYKCNDEKINYRVNIESVPSNLGKGEIYYFVCPNTRKHCRKLYFSCSYFLHRTAFTGLMYQNQIESKKSRQLLKIFNKLELPDEVYQERYKKYFKTHYNGKPTKRFLKLENKIRVSESFPVGTFERLLMS